MKVVQLLTQATGGPVDHAADLAVSLARLGHDSVLVMPAGAAAVRAAAAGVRHVEVDVGSLRDGAGHRALARALGRVGPDLLHCQDRRAGLLGRLWARRHRTPCVYTLHGVPDSLAHLVAGNLVVTPERRGDRVTYLRSERALARLSGGPVVSPSAALARYLTDRVGVPAAQVHVVPNGVDPDRYLPPGLERGDDGLTVGWVGSLVPCKRLDVLLDATAATEGVRLVLAGDGELSTGLRARADRLGLADRVSWLGRVPDAAPVLAGVDAVALTSAAENLPLSLLQGMSAARACVATTVGGVPEVISDGVDGLLVPPGEVAPLAAALARLRDDRAGARTLGAAARATVLSRFSTTVTADAMVGVYAVALARGPLVRGVR